MMGASKGQRLLAALAGRVLLPPGTYVVQRTFGLREGFEVLEGEHAGTWIPWEDYLQVNGYGFVRYHWPQPKGVQYASRAYVGDLDVQEPADA